MFTYGSDTEVVHRFALLNECLNDLIFPQLGQTTEWGFLGSGHDRTKATFESDSLFNITVSTIEADSGFVVVSDDILPTSTPLGKEGDRWGAMTSLHGLLGPVCLFSEPLSTTTIRNLNSIGTYVDIYCTYYHLYKFMYGTIASTYVCCIIFSYSELYHLFIFNYSILVYIICITLYIEIHHLFLYVSFGY